MSKTIVTTVRPFGMQVEGAVSNPRYEENQSKARHEGNYVDRSDCCCYCGKKTIPAKTFAFLTNISEFAVGEEYENENNDHLGLYPVGSDCAKLLKKHNVVLYTWEGKRA